MGRVKSLKKKTIQRCAWPMGNERMIEYHDTEWGVPLHDDRTHFEYILLDAFQAGLSWSTILNKRENFRGCRDCSASAKNRLLRDLLGLTLVPRLTPSLSKGEGEGVPRESRMSGLISVPSVISVAKGFSVVRNSRGRGGRYCPVASFFSP
jgi:hypothetical protein